jgi:hypothetical protein
VLERVRPHHDVSERVRRMAHSQAQEAAAPSRWPDDVRAASEVGGTDHIAGDRSGSFGYAPSLTARLKADLGFGRRKRRPGVASGRSRVSTAKS